MPSFTRRLALASSLLASVLAISFGALAPGAQAASSYTVAGHLDGLEYPYSVAVDQSSGDVYVADLNAGRVDEFEGSTTGTEILNFDGSETPQGASFAPKGVAVDAAGEHVWVVNSSGSVVDEFDASGEYSGTQLTGEGTPQGTEWDPEGVAISPTSGDIYVVDGAHGVVDVFSPAGAYERQFGELGSGEGQFERSYTDPAVDSEGNVYVRDSDEGDGGDGRIEEFNAAGQFVAVIDSEDAQTVAVEPSSNEVYVADAEPASEQLAEVNVYSSTGVLQSSFGSSAFSSAGIRESHGLAVSSATGQVYVTGENENEEGEVLIFARSSGSCAPTLSSGTATATATTATLSGELNPDGCQVTYFFSYGPSSTFETTSFQATVTAASTELTEVSSFAGVVVGAELAESDHTEGSVFDIPPGTTVMGVDPAAGTLIMSNAAYESAPNLALESITGRKTIVSNAGRGMTAEAVSAELEGLPPNTEYHFQLVAEADFGSVHVTGEDETFTTAHEAPATVTGQAAKVQPGTATLTGTVNPENTQTEYHFQYGTSASYGSEAPVPSASAGAGGSAESVSGAVAGLTQGTTYHYRLVATNSVGETGYGEDETFTTPSVSLATGQAGPVSQNSATVAGTLDPAGLETTYEFQYGTSTAYGSTTTSASAGSLEGYERESVALSGLAAGTTYHYRLVATNSAGTAYGEDETFTTYPAVSTGSSLALSVGPGGPELTLPPAFPALTIPTTTRPNAPKTTKPKPKRLTKAQKLKKALKQCKRDKSKGKRTKCKRTARKRYGAKKKKTKTKTHAKSQK